VQVGETVFESIDRLMRLRHVLSTDNARGDLVFIDVGSAGNATTALELGRNILEAGTELDFKAVMSRYIVKGQRAGTDADFGIDANEAEGQAGCAVLERLGSTRKFPLRAMRPTKNG